jgi:hypothetical protein
MQDIAGLFSEYSQTDNILSFRKHEFLFLRSVGFSEVVRWIVIHTPLTIDPDISIRPLVVFNSEASKSHEKCAFAFSILLNFGQDSR